MKIIKQNEGAEGLIFKQNGSGKAMKQNYNYDGGFIVTFDASTYFDIPIPFNVAGSFSIILYANKKIDGINNPAFIRLDALMSTFLTFTARSGHNSFNVNGTTSESQKIALGFSYNNGVVTYVNQQGVVKTFTKLLAANTSFIRVGINYSTIGKLIINNICVYNRAITSEELIYFRNNLLGNELLNVNALSARYPMQNFEILNGFVGFRDVAGSNLHVQMQGLPAGSLTDKLNFANANLIEKMF